MTHTVFSTVAIICCSLHSVCKTSVIDLSWLRLHQSPTLAGQSSSGIDGHWDRVGRSTLKSDSDRSGVPDP